MSSGKYRYSSTNKAKILIVEDHPVFRFGLRELLNQEEDLVVCGEAESTQAAWKEIQRKTPDLVIVDISLQDRIGLDLIKDINRDYSKIPVLVLSMHEEALYAERSLHAGAKGYIQKQEASEYIVEAVREVLRGKTYFSREFTEKLIHRFTANPDKPQESSVERLTDRELEVFRLFGNGHTTKEIADILHLSVKTIGTYRERIKEKLDLKSANELIKYAAIWVKKGDK